MSSTQSSTPETPAGSTVASTPNTSARPWLRNAVIALSFANLAFYRSWELCLDSSYRYYVVSVPTRLIDSTMLGVLMLAAIAWAMMFALTKLKSRLIARLLTWIAFAAVLLLNPFASALPELLNSRTGGLGTVLTLCAGLIVAVLFVIWPRPITRSIAVILLITAPLALVTFAQALRWRFGTSAEFRDPPNLSFAPNRPQHRVLWIVFDELDDALAFDRRPVSVKMPNFDQLHDEAWIADHAFPPADETLMSIPAMFMGTTVAYPEVKRANDMELRFADQRPRTWWSKEPSVFDTAQSIGVSSALIGWYHPYCRMFGARVSFCYQARGHLFDDLGGCADCAPDLRSAIADRALSILPYHTSGMTRYRSRWSRASELSEIPTLIEQAKSAAADPTFGLVYVHLGIPHPPAFYSRVSGQVTADGGSYLDNLAFTDVVLGEMRAAMKDSGVWDSTTVVICGDHWFRYNLHSRNALTTTEDRPSGSMEVPVIIRLPNQRAGLRYTKSFNTVILGKVVERLLQNPQASGEQVSLWVDDLSRTVPWDAIIHRSDW